MPKVSGNNTGSVTIGGHNGNGNRGDVTHQTIKKKKNNGNSGRKSS